MTDLTLNVNDMKAAVGADFVRQAGEIEGLDREQLRRGREVLESWTLTYGTRFPFGCEPLQSEWPQGATHRLVIDGGYIATAAQRRAVYFAPKMKE